MKNCNQGANKRFNKISKNVIEQYFASKQRKCNVVVVYGFVAVTKPTIKSPLNEMEQRLEFRSNILYYEETNWQQCISGSDERKKKIRETERGKNKFKVQKCANKSGEKEKQQKILIIITRTYLHL